MFGNTDKQFCLFVVSAQIILLHRKNIDVFFQKWPSIKANLIRAMFGLNRFLDLTSVIGFFPMHGSSQSSVLVEAQCKLSIDRGTSKDWITGYKWIKWMGQ